MSKTSLHPIVLRRFAICAGVLSAWGCDCGEGGTPLSKLAPRISVDPMALDFGAVPLGATTDLPLTVSNMGDDVLKLCVVAQPDVEGGCADVTHVDPSDAPYSTTFEAVADTGKWIVEKGMSRDVIVHFSPQTQATFDATLLLVHNAAGSTLSVPLAGSGVAPMVGLSTNTLDFGEVTVNQKKTLDLVLSNGTQFAQPFTVDPLMQAQVIFGLDGAAAPDQPLSGTIPGNGTLTLRVWYSPLREGADSNTLHVHYCPSCSKDVVLKGKGVKPQFQLIPPNLDFGTLNIMQSKTLSFVVRNVGNVNLQVSDVGLDQGTSPEYSVIPQSPLPATLAPMAELTVAVTYQGVNGGTDMGRVKVSTNAWDDPSTPTDDSVGFVALNAIASGPAINAIPATLNFGTVAINGPGVMKNLILENAGNAALTITSVTLNTPTPEYTLNGITPGVPTSVMPGASITVAVKYLPTNAGPDMANVVVVSNDPSTPMLTVPVQGIGGVPTGCALAIAPPQLNFGLVERGRTVTLPVEVRNTGAQPCSISNVRLIGAPEFALPAGAPTMFMVAAGSNQQVKVDFTPQSYNTFSSTLDFASDDPGQPMIAVPISGSSAPSSILVVPPQVDFGTVPVTCHSGSHAITVYNTGTTNVTITRVSLDPSTSPEFELAPFGTPASIPPGGSVVITLRYHPADIGPDAGVLFIQTSAAPQPFAVPLTGNGQVNPVVTDSFTQLPNPEVDVLFVVDNSASMQWAQSSLGMNLGAFLTYAQMQSVDYHIAVTTTDVEAPNSINEPYPPFGNHPNGTGGERGAFIGNPKIITPATPNASGVFQQTVNVGTDGSSLERGLEAAYLALSDPLINTANAGFLRHDAALAVIVVSDDDETRLDGFGNPEGANEQLDTGARPTDFYVNFFRSIKGAGNNSMFSFNAVVETMPGECAGSNDNAEASGWRYIQVVHATGGIVESICGNWGQSLSNIGLNTFGLRRSFTLTAQPIPTTISVTVDPDGAGPMPAVPVPALTAGGVQQWSYDGASNSVVFASSSTPGHGASISITYTVACVP